MKKLIMLLTCLCLLTTGCGVYDSTKAIKDFSKLVEENKTYYLEGKMSIISGEKQYDYDINVSYMKGDYYKVNLLNNSNSHEQVILKNDDGVYVINPSLNKSFKFQSDWPNNSSQAYVLESILKDINRDDDKKFEMIEDKYQIICNVNYPNNSSLVNQKIIFNKKMEPEHIEVLNNDNKPNIVVDITKIQWNKKFDNEYFNLNSSINEECCSDEEQTGKIEDIVYPMYIPLGTTFENQEVVNNDGNERVILTFKGEKPFILVEEVSNPSKEFEVTSASGDLVFYDTILGAITDTSVSWSGAGIDYYIVGQNLTSEEMLQIASSTESVAIVK